MKYLLIIISTLILASCATLPAKQPATNQTLSWSARQQQLKQVKSWTMNGALAIRVPKQAQSASFIWQQQADGYQMVIYGPMSIGRTTLNGNGTEVTLFTDGKKYTAKTPEKLMQEILGWQLPVSNLYYWIRGLPAPGACVKTQFDPFHHLLVLQQQGWKIEYQRYTAISGIDLPSKMRLTNGQLQLKLVIASWEFN